MTTVNDNVMMLFIYRMTDHDKTNFFMRSVNINIRNFGSI